MHATRLWTVTLEISVMMAQFPSKEIAQLSYDFRTLGLGYANIGGLLMNMGHSYDSVEGRALCGALDRDHDRRVPTRQCRNGGRTWGRSRVTSATPSTCCASCATTATRRYGEQKDTRTGNPTCCRLDQAELSRQALVELPPRHGTRH